MHTAHVVNALLLLLITAIPVALAGHPVLDLPAVGLGCLALLYGTTLLDKRAWWYNLPKKEAILELPDSDQEELFRRVDELFYWMTAALLVLLSYIQLILHLPLSVDATTAAALVGTVIFVVGDTVLLGFWLASFDNRVSDKLDEHRDE